MKTLLEGFDPVLGSWLGRGDWKGSFVPADIRAMPLCRMVFLGRQLKGQIPWSHPFSRMTEQDWLDVFHHIIPRAELYRPLMSEEVQKARALMKH